MRIRLLKRWGDHQPGEIIGPPDELAQKLVDARLAMRVVEKAVVETTAVAPVEKAVRKRGRPRKKKAVETA